LQPVHFHYLHYLGRLHELAHFAITRFLLENPVLMKLRIDDFISPGDIRTHALVEGIAEILGAKMPKQNADVEVYCVLLLTGAILVPGFSRTA
jgi:hypothetical protein